MKFKYSLRLRLRGQNFYKNIDSPVPMHKGESLTVDLPGPTIYCRIDDIDHAVSTRPYNVSVILVPTKDRGDYERESEAKLLELLKKSGWEWA